MLHREMLDLKFEDCDFVVPRAKGAEREKLQQGMSKQPQSFALAASVAGNVLAGAVFLGGLLFLPALLNGLFSSFI